MRVRYWSLNALSGEVAGELEFESATLGASIREGGGDLRAQLSLNKTTRSGASPDYPAIRRRLAMVQPGFRSIVATGVQLDRDGNEVDASKRVLGEWVVDSLDPDTGSPLVAVTGFEWSGYPAMLGLDATYGGPANAGWLLSSLLSRAFSGAAITVPSMTTGHSYALDRPIWSGQMGDAIQEVCDADPGLEWTVTTIPVWSGTALVGVNRVVTWGSPTVTRPSPNIFEAGEPLTRQGNARITGGGEVFSDYARQVVVLGSGEGSKQPIGVASNSGLTSRGYLNATKVERMSQADTQVAVDAQARGELARSQSSIGGNLSLPRTPWRVVAQADRIAELPKTGHTARLLHRQSWAWPGTGGTQQGALAIDEQVRIGAISYSVRGGICEEITMEVAK